MRIISLVPSLTELLIDLGLYKKVTGRTRFCIHPKEYVEKIPIIGGTKNPNIEKIRKINPDLIIANREENRKEDIDLLKDEFTVIVTDIVTIEDALLSIYEIGKLCGVEGKAEKLTSAIQKEMENVPDEPQLNVAYLIWRNPWMAAGSETYINSVLIHWKLKNIFSNRKRYPVIELNELGQIDPDYIFLSSEPFPFKAAHCEDVKKECASAKVIQVNGEWFSWYGSRMLRSFKKLNAFRKAIS